MVNQTTSVAATHACGGDAGGNAAARSPVSVLLDGQIRDATLAVDRLRQSLAAVQDLARSEDAQAQDALERIAELELDVAEAVRDAETTRAATAQAEISALQDGVDAVRRAKAYRAREILSLQENLDRQNARLSHLRNLRHFVASGRAVALEHFDAPAPAPVAAQPALPQPVPAAGPAPTGDIAGPPGAGAVLDTLMQALLSAQDAAAQRRTP